MLFAVGIGRKAYGLWLVAYGIQLKAGVVSCGKERKHTTKF